MKNVYILLLLLSVLEGCMVSPSAQSPSGANEEVRQGRRYFLRECGRCHGLIYPEERTGEEWQTVLGRKKAKVSLTAEQFQLMRQFVFTNAGP